jgi:hypothetical protein
MSKRPVLIAGIALLVICAGIWGLQAMKRQRKPIAAASAASTQGQRNPFRSAVVELNFSNRSLHNGEEYLSATGHRIAYIDVSSGRRREDYGRNVTALRQSTTVETLTGIFDGADLYMVTEKEGKRTGHVQKWWVWNGITLRSESHFEDATTVQDTTEEAVRLEVDGDIDPGLFALPADVTFEPAKPAVAEQQNHHKSAPWVRMAPEVTIFF